VTSGEYEAIAINPERVGWVVTKEISVKNGADFSGTKGQAQVSGVASGHGVHGKSTGFGG
jgi:hypothetical protein